MPEKITADQIFENIAETLADSVQKKKSVSFFEEETSSSVTAHFNRLFGRQKPVHHILGGGKSADVLLWRNKKISASVLMGATAIWVIFEWLNYHFLTIVSFALILGMLTQFFWVHISGLFNRSSSQVPRLVLPPELFANVGVTVGNKVNEALGLLQDISCRGNPKHLLMVVASLLVAAVIGSWCNFLTVLYLGFVAAHTLPVLYEKHDEKVDSFLYNASKQLQKHYQKVESGVLSQIAKGRFKGKKSE